MKYLVALPVQYPCFKAKETSRMHKDHLHKNLILIKFLKEDTMTFTTKQEQPLTNTMGITTTTKGKKTKPAKNLTIAPQQQRQQQNNNNKTDKKR
jgi:hypothetical protein